MMKTFTIISIIMFLLMNLYACNNETERSLSTSNQTLDEFGESFGFRGKQVSLEEASKLVGAEVPVPGYLPEGYDVQEVYIGVGNETVKLLISNGQIEKIDNEPQNGPKDYLIHSVKCNMYIAVSFEKDLRGVGPSSKPVLIPVTITPLDFFASQEGGFQVDWSVETIDGIASLRMQTAKNVTDIDTLKKIVESTK
jgi:hypothetical protein